MSLYDEVLNCPDTHCRKKALDQLCKEIRDHQKEKDAKYADLLAEMMESGAGEPNPGDRLRQVAEHIRNATVKMSPTAIGDGFFFL